MKQLNDIDTGVVRYVQSSDDFRNIVESWGGTSVYIPSKDMFLLIGGCYNRPHKRPGMLMGTIEPEPTGDIFRGIVRDSDGYWKWELITKDGPEMVLLNALVTADSKYVILSCLHSESKKKWCGKVTEGMEYIHILDIEDECQCRRTTIKSPMGSETAMMFRTGNDYVSQVTVCGYTRSMYREKGFEDLPMMPSVLVRLVQEYFSQELIHWVDDERHLAISVQDIKTSDSTPTAKLRHERKESKNDNKIRESAI